jgi:hypothetical protein
MTSKAIVPFGPGSAPGGNGVAQPARNIAAITTPPDAKILFIKKSHSQIEIFNCGFEGFEMNYPHSRHMDKNANTL